MQDNPTLAQQSTAVASAANRSVNISTDLEWMATSKVGPVVFRGARKYEQSEALVAAHGMSHMGATGACEYMETLFSIDQYDGQQLYCFQSGRLHIEMPTRSIEGYMCSEAPSFRKGMKADGCRLAKFVLSQKHSRNGVSFSVNHENVS